MKDVAGFCGEYAVTTDGRVWSHKRQQFMRLRGAGRSKHNKKRAYKTIAFWERGVGFRYFYVHRLVAEAFIENPESKPEVNHKNGVHDDNRVENLEWCTKQENTEHATENGFTVRGTKNGAAKLDESQVREIRAVYATSGESMRSIAQRYGVSSATIQLIVRRKKWAWLH